MNARSDLGTEDEMEPIKVTSVSTASVEKISFRFAHWGWMNVFLDDLGKSSTSCCNVGELAIHSDWGSWAYIWTGIGEGESLKQFICKADNDYLARKLLGGRDVVEWDPEATKAAIRKSVEEDAPDMTMRSDLLGELERCDWDSGMILWVERMGESLRDFLGGEPWEHIANKPSTEYTVLTEGLLPALKAYLEEQSSPETEPRP